MNRIEQKVLCLCKVRSSNHCFKGRNLVKNIDMSLRKKEQFQLFKGLVPLLTPGLMPIILFHFCRPLPSLPFGIMDAKQK